MAGRVVLVGAGHAHMEALRQARRFERACLSLTLIDPGAFWYSGAATGLLSGALERRDAYAQPDALNGAFRSIYAHVKAVDVSMRAVVLADGRRVPFDVLSLNTGSRIEADALIKAGAAPVKPVANLARVRELVEAARGRMRLAVIGAGATGVETALALAALQRRLGAPVRVVLAGPDPLLPDWPTKAVKEAARALEAAGVLRLPVRVSGLEDGVVVGEQSHVARVDSVLVATGLVANVPDGLGADAGGLPVGADLAWTQDAKIFAVGDCAFLTHAPRPKLGVFGVRAAPILINNLIKAGQGKTKRKLYNPQDKWLSLLDLGDGTALGRYGETAHRSKLAHWLKRRIDARFVKRYQPDHDRYRIR